MRTDETRAVDTQADKENARADCARASRDSDKEELESIRAMYASSNEVLAGRVKKIVRRRPQ